MIQALCMASRDMAIGRAICRALLQRRISSLGSNITNLLSKLERRQSKGILEVYCKDNAVDHTAVTVETSIRSDITAVRMDWLTA